MNEIEILKTKRFDSEIQFQEFIKELDKLILSSKLKYFESENFRDINFRKYKDSESFEYCLSEPDLYWRGFFLEYNEAIRFINTFRKLDKQKSLGCLGVFLIIILITIVSIILK